jgi:hypothetical protein
MWGALTPPNTAVAAEAFNRVRREKLIPVFSQFFLFSDLLVLGRNPIRTRCARVIHDLAPTSSLIAASTDGGNIGFLPSPRAAEKPQKREPDRRRKGAAMFMWVT